MESKVSFLDLPTILVALLVSEWLKWKDIGRLDSAMCNKFDRLEWLNLLNTNCGSSFVCIGCPWENPSMHQWFVARKIRTWHIEIGHEGNSYNEVTRKWLKNTNFLVTSAIVHENGETDQVLAHIVQLCGQLKKLVFSYCRMETSCWNLVSTARNLKEIHICGQVHRHTIHVPTDFSHCGVQKLSISWTAFADGNALTLIQQLPMVRYLDLRRCSMTDIFNTLPSACPNLLYLDLLYAKYEEDDGELFVDLMKGLKRGLLGLVLPATHFLTEREIQAIRKFHANSLRCLRIMNSGMPDQESAIADLVNNLPHLHTLLVDDSCLEASSSYIVNPSIVDLHVSYRGSVFLGAAVNRMPALKTLRLHNWNNKTVVSNVIELLRMCTRIQTVYIDCEKVVSEVQNALSGVKCVMYEEFDMFSSVC